MECIELFKNLSDFQNSQFQILIIDNFSKESDISLLKAEIPENNLLLNNRNIGYAAANNIGISKALEANAKYIWILNPDIRVDEYSLKTLLETIRSNKRIAAVGPRILKRENPELIFSDGEILNCEEGIKTFHKNHNLAAIDLPPGVDFNVDYIDGSSILLAADAIKELGALPEEYFLYFEETDWCYRAKSQGWNLAVNSEATVYNLTSEKREIFHYYFYRNRLIFSKKFGLNYSRLLIEELSSIITEIFNRFKGVYLKPYFASRIKGIMAGIFYYNFTK